MPSKVMPEICRVMTTGGVTEEDGVGTEGLGEGIDATGAFPISVEEATGLAGMGLDGKQAVRESKAAEQMRNRMGFPWHAPGGIARAPQDLRTPIPSSV